MDCNKYQKLISAEIDGLLNNAEALSLQEHCNSCSYCREERKKAAEIHKICGSFSPIKLDDDFKYQLANPVKIKKHKSKLLISAGIAAAIACISLAAIKIYVPNSTTKVMLNNDFEANANKKTGSTDVSSENIIESTEPKETVIADDLIKYEASSEKLAEQHITPATAKHEVEPAAEAEKESSTDTKIPEQDVIKAETNTPDSSNNEQTESVVEHQPQNNDDIQNDTEEGLSEVQSDTGNTDNTYAPAQTPELAGGASVSGSSGGGSSSGSNYSAKEDTNYDSGLEEPEKVSLITSDESRTLVYDAIADSAPEIVSVASSDNFTITLNIDQFQNIVNQLNSSGADFVISQSPKNTTLSVSFIFQTSSQEINETNTENPLSE